MTWHYRILRHSDGSLALHEVYCDEAGQPNGCANDPVSFVVDADEGAPGIIAGAYVNGILRQAIAEGRF